MTDEMRAREKAICEAAKVDDIGEVSDGFHTFNSLYEQRMILFAALVKAYKDKSWKSYRHEDGEYCFGGGWFIVGIDTPEGSYTYHYENKYWDMFDCIDLPRAKHWNGHTEADAEVRLMSLKPERKQAEGDCISRQAAIDTLARMMPHSYTPDGSHPADEEIYKAQEIYADCIESIEILPAAQPEQRWIPCSKRLPEDGRCLVTRYDSVTNTCFSDILWYEKGVWWNRLCIGDFAVIAWMPLPEPYRGGGEWVMKRNLDGIYLRIKRDGKYQPICLSDMTADELEEALDPEKGDWLKGAVIHLSQCLREIGDQFCIVNAEVDK